MESFESLALYVEGKGTEMLAELNAIRNNHYARKAKLLLLELMADANRALIARCPTDDPFEGLTSERSGQALPPEGCCKHLRCGANGFRTI